MNGLREVVTGDADERAAVDDTADDDDDDTDDAGKADAVAEAPESGAGKPAKPKSLRVEVRSALVTMVMAVVQTSLIAWFGFSLSGRLELAIKDRKATVDGAMAMGDLIIKLHEEQSADVDRTLVLRMTMFGEDAIGPLVIMAMTPGAYGVDIPIFGLRRLGITHRDSTCKALAAGRASNAWIQDPARAPLLDTLFEEMKC